MYGLKPEEERTVGIGMAIGGGLIVLAMLLLLFFLRG